jgi:hypothetical protein
MYNTGMGKTFTNRSFLSMVALLLFLTTFPYLLAWWQEGEEFFFSGFLINPLDGNSYLAKMYQGWEGSWKFHLPFTVEPGEGGYIFLYYLFLGHISRIISLPLLVTYHLARSLGAILLVISLWNFFGRIFRSRATQELAFSLSIFGSGSGGIASIFGLFTSDLWVAEAYPFLSVFTNPHFPLGLALLVWLLTPSSVNENQIRAALHRVLVIPAAFILGIVMPFGVVVACVVLSGLVIWEAWEIFRSWNYRFIQGRSIFLELLGKSYYFQQFIRVLSGGFPILVYDYWISKSDPVLAKWNLQNLTPSPPVWDLILSLTPVLLLAVPGAIKFLRSPSSSQKVLFIWTVFGVVLLYLPFELQRRFMLGLFIPISGLAVIGLRVFKFNHIQQGEPDRYLAGDSITHDLVDYRKGNPNTRFGVASLFLIFCAIPTNLLILLGAIQAARMHDPMLYLTRNEARALAWIKENTPDDAIILASPQIGMFLPGRSGRRVFYGHPYETVEASKMEAAVEAALRSGIEGESNLLDQADYVFWGPREAAIGEGDFSRMVVVFQSGDVSIYKVHLEEYQD